MRWLALCLVLVAGDAFGVEVSAYASGNELLGWCKEAEKVADDGSGAPVHAGQCYGYLKATHDGYATWRAWGHISSDRHCIPESVTVGQLRRIVVKFLEAHPEQLHLLAGSLVLNAYQEAFPCE